VVFDTSPSTPTPDAKLEAESKLGSSGTLAQAERQPFDAFAEMAIPSGPVFDRPAPPARLRSGRPRRLRKARHFKIAPV